MDLATLARVLGHASLRMVMKYVRPTQEHQDASMERFEKSQAHSRPTMAQKQADFHSNEPQPGAKVN
jgi:hypothetical protein